VLTISKVAREAGVAPDTVRYYEREGLIPPPARTSGGYRIYGEETIRRLRFIRGSQRFGLRLRDVKALLDVIDRGACPCGHASELVRSRLAEVDQQLADLRTLRADLVRLSEDLGPETCTPGVWPCEQQLVQVGGGDGNDVD
jgi:DNA-binding transcriptional MerR regulator